MEHAFAKQTKRVGIAVAVAAALAALGTETAQAQQFTSASIALDNSGNLQCKFRETGLGANSLVTYDCAAEGVGVVTGCFVKNKFVGPFAVAIVKNVAAEETDPVLAKNNGAINTAITAEVPEGGGEVQCNEAAGAEPHTVAVRWCNDSLTDMTNNVVGATASDLVAIILRTSDQLAPMPTCAEILAGSG